MINVLDSELKLTLVKCYIMTPIDYCNVLRNVAMYGISRLQKLLNISMRSVYNISKSVGVTPYLK